MKILHVSKYFYPHIGGVETHVKELSQQLVNHEHEVSVITYQHSTNLALEEDFKQIHIIRIPFDHIEKKVAVWKWFTSHSSIFKSYDVIHVHDVFWWVLPLYPILRKKIFMTFHGWETQFPIPVTAKLQRYVFSKLAKKTIHVGGWIKEFYWDIPDFITYGGTTVRKKRHNAFPKNLTANVVFIGRLASDNAVIEYISVVKKLTKMGWHINMIWVGDGEFRNHCEEVGEVTGFIKNIQPYLKNADYIFASSYLAILESQSYGKVVCSLFNSKIKERYLKTYPGIQSMLIASKPSKLAHKIAHTNEREFSILSKQSQDFVQQHTWEHVANLYEKMWKSL